MRGQGGNRCSKRQGEQGAGRRMEQQSAQLLDGQVVSTVPPTKALWGITGISSLGQTVASCGGGRLFTGVMGPGSVCGPVLPPCHCGKAPAVSLGL